jgi:hypothetical protein
VGGLVLVNPWVYTEQGAASVRVRSYYARRLVSADFWKKLFAGGVPLLSSVREFSGVMARAVGGGHRGATEAAIAPGALSMIDPSDLVNGFLRAMQSFPRPVQLVLSGNDYTAKEFDRAVAGQPALCAEIQAKHRRLARLSEADHTFSKETWQDEVERLTIDFLEAT